MFLKTLFIKLTLSAFFQRFFKRYKKNNLTIFIFRFRSFLGRIVRKKQFDYFILAFIMANCITITFEKPSLNENAEVSGRVGLSELKSFSYISQ